MKPLDLHQVNWGNIAVPGAACYQSGMIQLHGGSALVADSKRGTPLPPGTGPKFDQVDDYPTVIYGEVQPGQQNAIVTLDCTNNSSTNYLSSVAVFSGQTGKLKVMGLLTPRVQPIGGQPTELEPFPVARGSLLVGESYTAKGNDSGLASGFALTTWTYTNGRLKPTGTTNLTDPSFGGRRVSQAESDLTSIDWKNIAVPSASCYRPTPIQLHDGDAKLLDPKRGTPIDPARTGPGYDSLDSWASVTYGQITPGQWDAFVPLTCSNSGGTADGALLYSVAVYSGRKGDVRALGLITPQVQPADVLPTLLGILPVKPGLLVAHEAYYNPADGTCCPTGQALTTWTFRNGHLIPGRPKLIAVSLPVPET